MRISDTDQPVHSRILVSTFVIDPMKRIITRLQSMVHYRKHPLFHFDLDLGVMVTQNVAHGPGKFEVAIVKILNSARLMWANAYRCVRKECIFIEVFIYMYRLRGINIVYTNSLVNIGVSLMCSMPQMMSVTVNVQNGM